MLKSVLKRIFPSFLIISAIRFFIFDLEVTFLFWPEILLFAFLWGAIRTGLGGASGKYDEMLVAIPVVGTFITLSWPMAFIVKVPAIISAVYLFVTCLRSYLESEIKNKDRIKARKFLFFNLYEMRRMARFSWAVSYIIEAGAKMLGANEACVYFGETEEINAVSKKLHNMGYSLFTHSTRRIFVLGRDGIVVLRFITTPGEYEYKKNKWFKDGKTCTNLTEEGNKILSMLKGERGTNKFVIVKAFEGGSVKGQGCGFLVLDMTKDQDSVVNIVNKTTRVDNFKDKLKKKRRRVITALSIE